MGLLGGLFGNASEVNAERVEQELQQFLIDGERIEHAFTLIRDMIIFSNKRVIMIDKQGYTGKKKEYVSIPYGSIVRYSMESTGSFDIDAEIKLWVRSQAEPIELEFRRDKSVVDVYRVLSKYILN